MSFKLSSVLIVIGLDVAMVVGHIKAVDADQS